MGKKRKALQDQVDPAWFDATGFVYVKEDNDPLPTADDAHVIDIVGVGSYSWGAYPQVPDVVGPPAEEIDDPTERLKALAERDGTHDREARDKARGIFFRDMVWRPYVRAGMPYGDTEDDAKRWAEEQKAARVEDDVDMSWYTPPPEPDLTFCGIPSVGLTAVIRSPVTVQNVYTIPVSFTELDPTPPRLEAGG